MVSLRTFTAWNRTGDCVGFVAARGLLCSGVAAWLVVHDSRSGWALLLLLAGVCVRDFLAAGGCLGVDGGGVAARLTVNAS